ncbi:TonB-dependent receptor domain-containing protein [Brevundimonas sp.]|uniref:TonB-dependent receptor domain-containing protein n=1 Tax=Brevundimonas sp. TaxID=1871086 RepID=UPI002ABA0632|nr:TonB-dependent receptor [Brevundimonas sp.]MDZ4363251.1 TonB-dependent receptor [Brevundimonas sp.]
MTVHRSALAAVLTLGVSALALSAQAQEATSVDEIVVTASGFEQRIEQAPASITLISGQEIRSQRAGSIAEILADVPGVDIGGAVGKTGGLNINIRGLGSDYTLILIDGRRQNTAGSVTPNGFGETSTSFLPPVSAIERIEVVRGPVSTLYGSDAIGGVINIITKKVGETWQGTVSANATLQSDDEFGNLYGGDVYANGPLVADLLGLAVRGSYLTREQSSLTYENVGGVQTPVTGFGRSSTESEIWTLGARLSLTPHADHDLWLDVDVARQWYDNANSQLGTATTAGGYGNALEFNRDQAVLAHDWRLGFGELANTLSWGRTETIGRIIPNGVPGAGGPRDLETESVILDTKFSSQFRNHTYTLGGQYWDASMTDGVAPAAFEFTQWALFAEDEWRFTDTLALTLGGRYDDHSTFGDHFSPRAYLVWNATANWTIKGGVSQGFKTPRLEQLAPGINGFGQQGRLPLLGSPGLQPETSTAAEVSFFYDNRDDFRASLTLFDNQFEDKIASGPPVVNCAFGVSAANYAAGNYNQTGCTDVGFFPNAATFGQSVNIDEAVTRGVEVNARWAFADAWSVSGNYTYTDSEQKSGAEAGLPLTDTPQHMVNAALNWQATDRLSTWVRGEYRSERYRGEGAARTALGDYKAYEVFHLGAAYDLTDRVTLNAVVYNVFDKDFVSLLPYGTPVVYAPEYTNNQEPRRLWVSVRVDF